MGVVEVKIRDTGDLKRLTRQLGRTAEGKEVRAELGRACRNILRPILAEVKALYSGGSHLRPALKRATKMEVRLTGKYQVAHIIVDGRRMPSGMRKIPQYWEGEASRWRHPLFGDREHWYDQSPRPSFYRIASGHDLAAEREIAEAESQSLRPLERG